jgi:hypothetical protein
MHSFLALRLRRRRSSGQPFLFTRHAGGPSPFRRPWRPGPSNRLPRMLRTASWRRCYSSRCSAFWARLPTAQSTRWTRASVITTGASISGRRRRAAEIAGYEIHMGQIERDVGSTAAFQLVSRNGEPISVADGAVSSNGSVVGTMVHGIFDNPLVRTSLVRSLRKRRGLAPLAEPHAAPPRQDEFDRLAAMLREHVDSSALRAIIGAR